MPRINARRVKDLVSEEVYANLLEYEKSRIKDNLNNNKKFFWVIVSFPLRNFNKQLAKLQKKLHKAGEICTTIPKVKQNPEENIITFQILLASDKGEKHLLRLLKTPGQKLDIKQI